MLDVPAKIVLHTTEVGGLYRYNPASYFGHPYWPHATIDALGIHQHIAIDAGAYALYRGGVDTNRANAVQCEIMAYASSIEELDDDTLGHVADWVRWVAEQAGAPLEVCPQGFHGTGEGFVLASEDSPIRFGDDAWLGFSGICGHQHVPSGNDHWDPGRFPVERLFAAMGAPTEEDDMFTEEDRAMLVDLRKRMQEEGDGLLSTPSLLESIAGVVNETKAAATFTATSSAQFDIGLFAQFDPQWPARKDAEAGRDEFVRIIKSLDASG